jgi:hypothetical protein
LSTPEGAAVRIAYDGSKAITCPEKQTCEVQMSINTPITLSLENEEDFLLDTWDYEGCLDTFSECVLEIASNKAISIKGHIATTLELETQQFSKHHLFNIIPLASHRAVFSLPNIITVSDGNTDKKQLTVTFDKGQCLYQGAHEAAHEKTHSDRRELNQNMRLKFCEFSSQIFFPDEQSYAALQTPESMLLLKISSTGHFHGNEKLILDFPLDVISWSYNKIENGEITL